jgi:hypothetical protein
MDESSCSVHRYPSGGVLTLPVVVLTLPVVVLTLPPVVLTLPVAVRWNTAVSVSGIADNQG